MYKPLKLDKVFRVLDDIYQGRATPFQWTGGMTEISPLRWATFQATMQATLGAKLSNIASNIGSNIAINILSKIDSNIASNTALQATPDLGLLDSKTSAWWGLGWIELKQGSKYKGPCQVYYRVKTGSLERPRRVLDPMRVDLCFPRVPWPHFGS